MGLDLGDEGRKRIQVRPEGRSASQPSLNQGRATTNERVKYELPRQGERFNSRPRKRRSKARRIAVELMSRRRPPTAQRNVRPIKAGGPQRLERSLVWLRGAPTCSGSDCWGSVLSSLLLGQKTKRGRRIIVGPLGNKRPVVRVELSGPVGPPASAAS